MNAQEKTQDKVTETVDKTARAINEMSNDGNMTTDQKIIALGSYINDNDKALAEKVNEMDENIKKTKTSSNLAAIGAWLGIGIGAGAGLYYYVNKRTEAAAQPAMGQRA